VACMQPRHCAPDISRQWANFAESNRGSIVAGKYADLVLLSNDLFRIPKERIRDARVVYTRVGGKQEYRDF